MKHTSKTLIVALFGVFAYMSVNAQGTITFQCEKLNLSKTTTLKCDPIAEDDPGDLAEAYSKLFSWFPKEYNGSNHQLKLAFPAHVGTFSLSQQNKEGENDSLYAKFVYNLDSKTSGKEIDANPKDFTIQITRYDSKKGGTIEGTFKGTMYSDIPWNHSTVTFQVKGNFQTIRNGEGSECRKQRKSEKIVINNSVDIFTKNVAAPLQTSGWQIKSLETGVSSQVSNGPLPYRPMMLCSDFYDLKLNINPKSAYGKMLQDSAEYYAKQSSIQATKNMYRILSRTKVEIRILENDPYLQTHDAPDSKAKFTLLHIPGTAYAYQYYEPGTEALGRPDEHTSLYFGNWKGIRNTHNYVPYPFMHKKQAAVIENFVVTITAPSAVAHKIIKSINWVKLDAALSK